MTGTPRLLLAASQLEWATSLRRHVVEHGGANLVGEAMTVDEIRDRSDFDVVAIDDMSSLLSPGLVGELGRSGRRVLLLTGPGRPDAVADRLERLGVPLSEAVAADAPAHVIVSRVRELAVSGVPLVPPGGELVTGEAVHAGPPLQAASSGSERGRRVAVLGTEAVTELCVVLAAVAARAERRCVVVDVDSVEPAVAQRLGTPTVPNVLTMSEELRQGVEAPSTIQHPEGFDVVAGLANPKEWRELSPSEVGEVAGSLSMRFDLVVLRCGRMLEDVAPMMSLEGRFDADRRVVQDADDVVVVTSGSPMGLVRVLSMAGDVRVLTAAPLHVVVNRAPSKQFHRGEWQEELYRSLQPASLSWLPTDGRVEAAAWDARIASKGPFWRAVRRLAGPLLVGVAL